MRSSTPIYKDFGGKSIATVRIRWNAPLTSTSATTYSKRILFYIFLDGLDDHLDNIHSDVLQIRPFPSIEQAYAHVHREALQQAVMSAGDPNNTSGAVLATKGLKLSSATLPSVVVSSQPTGKSSKSRTVLDGTKWSHCGNQRHTSENCF